MMVSRLLQDNRKLDKGQSFDAKEERCEVTFSDGSGNHAE